MVEQRQQFRNDLLNQPPTHTDHHIIFECDDIVRAVVAEFDYTQGPMTRLARVERVNETLRRISERIYQLADLEVEEVIQIESEEPG